MAQRRAYSRRWQKAADVIRTDDDLRDLFSQLGLTQLSRADVADILSKKPGISLDNFVDELIQADAQAYRSGGASRTPTPPRRPGSGAPPAKFETPAAGPMSRRGGMSTPVGDPRSLLETMGPQLQERRTVLPSNTAAGLSGKPAGRSPQLVPRSQPAAASTTLPPGTSAGLSGTPKQYAVSPRPGRVSRETPAQGPMSRPLSADPQQTPMPPQMSEPVSALEAGAPPPTPRRRPAATKPKVMTTAQKAAKARAHPTKIPKRKKKYGYFSPDDPDAFFNRLHRALGGSGNATYDYPDGGNY